VTVPDETMQALAEMGEASRRRRASRAETAWRTLRRYERRLVKEAAVMGYVLGYRNGGIEAREGYTRAEIESRWLGDVDVIRTVIEHCDSTADLYPYLADACNGRRRRVTRTRLWPGEQAATAPTEDHDG